MKGKFLTSLCIILAVFGAALLLTIPKSRDTYTSEDLPEDMTSPEAVNNEVKETSNSPTKPAVLPPTKLPTLPIPTVPISSITENFDTNYTVTEVEKMSKSKNTKWWLGSGAYFYSSGGVGKTVIGPLPTNDKFRLSYLVSNPLDTDSGFHPQNIFRLVYREIFKNYQQEVYFKVVNTIMSESPNRNESNGVELFNRYQDADNLYYVGMRVDGQYVVKKKTQGTYYTMSYKSYTNESHNRVTNPNLLPMNTWIGLRSVVKDMPDGSVNIEVYSDQGKTGKWILVLTATDDGKKYGATPVFREGYTGIRTDFMDVEFDDYNVMKI